MSSSRPHCTGDECRHEDPPEEHEDNIFASERTRRPTPAPAAALDEPDDTTTDPDTTMSSSSASDTDSTGQADESSTSLSCTPDEEGVIASSMTSTAPSSTPLQQQQSVLYAYQVELDKSAPDSTLPSVLSLLERRISQHALAPALLNDECDEGGTTTAVVAANNNDTPSTRHLQESDVLLISTDPPDQVMEGEPCLNINSSFCWVVSGEATIYSSPTVLSSTQLLLAQDTIRKSMTKHSDLYIRGGDFKDTIVSISYRQDIVERQVLMNNNNNNDMNNQSSNNNNNTGIIVGCILLSFGLICMVGGVLYLYWRRRHNNNNSTDNLVPLGIEAHEYDSTYDLQPLEKSFESGEHPLNTSWDELWNQNTTSRNDDDLLLIGIPPRGLEHNNERQHFNATNNNFIMMDRPATQDDREYDTDEYIHEVPKSIVTTTASYTTHSSSSTSWGESIQNDLLMDVDDCSSISSGSLYVNEEEEGDSRKKKNDKAHNSIEIGIV